MKKIQILFPDPLMKRLRLTAQKQDRPISDIVRRATEEWLDRSAVDFSSEQLKRLPRFHGGGIKTEQDNLRAEAYPESAENE